MGTKKLVAHLFFCLLIYQGYVQVKNSKLSQQKKSLSLLNSKTLDEISEFFNSEIETKNTNSLTSSLPDSTYQLSEDILKTTTYRPLPAQKFAYFECPSIEKLSIKKSQSSNSRQKFLLPILKWGPNNQIRGFYESLRLAIDTNRTLVIPPMFRHLYDTLSEKNVPAYIRLNLEAINHYHSTVSLEDYKLACGNRFTTAIIINGNEEHYEDIYNRDFNEESGIFFKFSGYTDSDYEIIETVQRNFKTVDQAYSNLVSNIKRSEKNCMIIAKPYRTLAFVNENNFPLQVSDLPAYAYAMADTFLKSLGVPGIDYAIHWRFDPEDWSNRCNDDHNIDGRNNLECEYFSKLQDENFPRDFFTRLLLSEHVNSQGFRQHRRWVIFIATPDRNKNFIESLKKYADQKLKGIQIYSTFDSVQFFNENYKNCDLYQRWKGEVMSFIDQAIVMRCTRFLMWSKSSWSGRIRQLILQKTANGEMLHLSQKVRDIQEILIDGYSDIKQNNIW